MKSQCDILAIIADHINTHRIELDLPCEITVESRESAGEQLSLRGETGEVRFMRFIDGGFIGNFNFSIVFRQPSAKTAYGYAQLDKPLWKLMRFLENTVITTDSISIDTIEMLTLPHPRMRESNGNSSNQASFRLTYSELDDSLNKRVFDIEISNEKMSQSLMFQRKSAFRIMKINGLSSPEFLVRTKSNAVTAGSRISNLKVDKRIIEIMFIINSTESETTRENLLGMFSPNQKYTINVNRNGIKRRISAWCERFDLEFSYEYGRYVGELRFICPAAYFYDYSLTCVKSSRYEPLFNLPFESFIGIGMTLGIQNKSNNIKVENDGDDQIGIEIEIKALGDVVNPKIKNSENEIKILKTLHINDLLKIRSGFDEGDSSEMFGIWLNGGEIFDYDPSSVWFHLDTGEHFIEFDADEGAANVQVKVKYLNKWLGV